MMSTYLGEDSDGLDGFEFLSMAEAGEVGHWAMLGKLSEDAQRRRRRRNSSSGRCRSRSGTSRPCATARSSWPADEDPDEPSCESRDEGRRRRRDRQRRHEPAARARAPSRSVDEIGVGVARRRPQVNVSAHDRYAQRHRPRRTSSRRFAAPTPSSISPGSIQPVARSRADARRQRRRGRGGWFAAVARRRGAGLVYASSVGAYSPGPKDRPVDERGRRAGSRRRSTRATRPRSSGCSTGRGEHPRARRAPAPGPDLQARRGVGDPAAVRRAAAAQPLLRRRWIPIVPADRAPALSGRPRRRRRRGLPARHLGDVRGAFNIAAEPVLDGEALGRLLGARPLRVPARSAARRRGGGASSLRLHADAAGLAGHGARGPADGHGARARRCSGGSRARDAGEALLELFDGMRGGDGLADPDAGARRRRPPARARVPHRRRRARAGRHG